MNLLRVGNRTINLDNIVETRVYEPGEIARYRFGRKQVDGEEVYGDHPNEERVVRMEATAVVAGEYHGSGAYQIELTGGEADAFVRWLDANATNLTPKTEMDEEWEHYKREVGVMNRDQWEATRREYLDVSATLDSLDPSSEGWKRQMDRASRLEVKLGY